MKNFTHINFYETVVEIFYMLAAKRNLGIHHWIKIAPPNCIEKAEKENRIGNDTKESEKNVHVSIFENGWQVTALYGRWCWSGMQNCTPVLTQQYIAAQLGNITIIKPYVNILVVQMTTNKGKTKYCETGNNLSLFQTNFMFLWQILSHFECRQGNVNLTHQILKKS